jgi:hypothetical protein
MPATGPAQKDVAAVFAALAALIGRELGKEGPGPFAIPGLVKLQFVRKPATKERQGVSPFTGAPMTFKARPARHVVRARPLKKLRELG